jgi:hypothetical protein
MLPQVDLPEPRDEMDDLLAELTRLVVTAKPDGAMFHPFG